VRWSPRVVDPQPVKALGPPASYSRVAPAHCCAGAPSEPDVRLSPHPAQACPSGLIARGPTIRSGSGSGSSAGPLITTEVVASSLSIGWGVVVIVGFGAHLTTSALFQAVPHGPVSGRLSTPISRRTLIDSAWFPAAFRPPAFASWSSCSRPGVELSLRSAYRHACAWRTLTGFPCFARTSCDRGGCPLYSEDGGAHPDRSRSPASACRITATCPCAPPQHPSMRGSASRSINQGFTQVSSVRSSPRLALPVWTAAPWAFPRASYPADQEPATHVGAGTGHRART
jgi:hypothetical protein